MAISIDKYVDINSASSGAGSGDSVPDGSSDIQLFRDPASGRYFTPSEYVGTVEKRADGKYYANGAEANVVTYQTSVTGGIDSYAGNVWLGKTFFAGTTYESALDAINAAYANGGGVVKFPRALLHLGSHYLPIKDGVHYRGQGWALTYANIPDDQYVQIDESVGTVITNDGSCPLFWDEKADRASAYSSQGAFSNDATHATIKGFGLKGGTYGVKCGANFAPGVFYGEFDDLCAVGASQWGFWFENQIHVHYGKIYSYANAEGQAAFVSSCSSAILQPGNCTVGEVVCTAPTNYLSRGIEIRSKNGTDGGIAHSTVLQSNRFGNTPMAPESATANGTTSLTVANPGKFKKDLPVYLSSVGTTGLSATICYVVKSVSGNVLQLANSPHEAALSVPAGSIVIESRGFAPLSAIGESTSDKVFIGDASLDLEAGGTTKLWLSRSGPCNLKSAGGVVRDTSSFVDVCCRDASYPIFQFSNGVKFDIDGATSGQHPIVLGPVDSWSQNRPTSFLGTYSGKDSLNLHRFPSSSAPTLRIESPGNGDFAVPGIVIGTNVLVAGNQAWSFNAGVAAGVVAYNGTTATTWTWNQSAGASMVGFKIAVKNIGTAVLTFVLGGSGNGSFDGNGKTTVTLSAPTASAPGGYFEMCCVASGSWVVIAMQNAAFA